MAGIIILLLTALLVAAAATIYTYWPSKKLQPWFLSIPWKAAFLPEPAERNIVRATDREKGVSVGRAELERVFATFDKDGDGYITVAELEESLHKLGLPTTSEEVAHMLEELDTNRDGLLDLDEFRELYKSIGGSTATEEEEEEEELFGSSGGGGRRIRIQGGGDDQAEEERDLKEAFDVFDGNGDGRITVEELGMVLAALGLAPGATAASCRDMIKKVDMDGDGMVSFDEFKQMMRGANGSKLF